MGKKLRANDPPVKSQADSHLEITPGGLRDKKLVRQVKRGEAVRKNKDGTYTIVPTQPPKQN